MKNNFLVSLAFIVLILPLVGCPGRETGEQTQGAAITGLLKQSTGDWEIRKK